MTDDRRPPTISVCIPSYKQPTYLKRAVESVFAQTYQDWEMLVSDDEDPPGESWRYLEGLPAQDARVRVMRNPGRHGQVPNTNYVMLQARGQWVKPLHHDDVLRPECLETLLHAAGGLPSVVMVSSRASRYVDGSPHTAPRRPRRGGRAPLELIPQRYVHLAMYLQDCHAGVPTQVMVRREAIKKGALFEEAPGIVSGVDALWNNAVLKHGDLLFVNQVLVEHHQHRGTVTASLTSEEVEAEYPVLLARVRESIDPALTPPPLPVVLGMAKCIRGFYHLKHGNFSSTRRLLGEAKSAASWLLAARWAASQVFPGWLHAVPRIPVASLESPGGSFGRSQPAGEKSIEEG